MHVKRNRTEVSRRSGHIYLLSIFEPGPRRTESQHQTAVFRFVYEHIAINLKPCAVGRRRTKALSPCPAMLHRLKDRLAESAGHQTVESSDQWFHIITQQV